MVKIKKQKIRPHKKIRQLNPGAKYNFKSVFRFISWVLLVGAIGAIIVGFQYMFVDSDLFNVKRLDVKLYDEKGVLRKADFSIIEDKDILDKYISC